MAKTKKTEIVFDADSDSKLIENSTIQNKTDKEKKGILTVKNVVLLSFFLLVSITVLALTIVFILNIDFSSMFTAMSHGFARKIGILWFFLLLFFFVYSTFCQYATVWLRLRKWGYKIPQWEYWMFGASMAFLRAVTPVLFADPFSIFWLRTKGVPTSKATSLLFSNTLFWQFVQETVTLPSFIMVMINYSQVATDAAGISAITFLCLGIVTDLGCIIFMIAINMSRKMHSGLSKIFNWIKKKLHMQYHTKAEIEEKYKAKATIRRDFIESIKDWKTTIGIVLIFVLSEVVTYFAITWSLYFIQYTSYGDFNALKVTFDFGWAFNCANVTFTANRLNFIVPNGEGSLEFFLSEFLKKLGQWDVINLEGSTPVPQEIKDQLSKDCSNNAILIWRTFGTYIPALFGLGTLGGIVGKQINYYKHHKTIVKA